MRNSVTEVDILQLNNSQELKQYCNDSVFLGSDLYINSQKTTSPIFIKSIIVA